MPQLDDLARLSLTWLGLVWLWLCLAAWPVGYMPCKVAHS